MTIKNVQTCIESIRNTTRECIKNNDKESFSVLMKAERELEKIHFNRTGQQYNKRPAYKSFKKMESN